MAAPQQPPENKQPAATKITGKAILEAIRLMNAEERNELTKVLFMERKAGYALHAQKDPVFWKWANGMQNVYIYSEGIEKER